MIGQTVDVNEHDIILQNGLLTEGVFIYSVSIADMPAVSSFSKYASLSVALNFLLQVTMLVSVITLDEKRQSNNRYDVACCVVSEYQEDGDLDDNCLCGGVLRRFMSKYYAPCLLFYPVRVVVVSDFVFS